MVKNILAISALSFFLAAGSAFAETRTVTKTADTRDSVCDADCSLREAVSAAGPGDTIRFEGGGVGVHQLTIGAIAIDKENLTMDGGEGHAVVIRGRHAEFVQQNNLGGSFNCFTVKSSGNTLRGLVIQNCYYGVVLFGSTKTGEDGKAECPGPKGNKIENNFIGTSQAGDAAVGNYFGVRIYHSSENMVGPGNVISGNIQNGVYLDQACTTNNRVEGNLIGTKAGGLEALPNMRYGVVISTWASANIIGGEKAKEANVISGNNWTGIVIGNAAPFNQILGNTIGLDKEGKKGLGNSSGVYLISRLKDEKTVNNRIAGNVITGQATGIAILGAGTENNVIEKNIIGLGPDLQPIGGAPFGNSQYGIVIRSNRNTIGGEKPSGANVIAHNGIYGIFPGEIRYNIDNKGTIHSDGGPLGNRLLINSIFNNGRDGIRFDTVGPPAHNGISKLQVFAQPEAEPPADGLNREPKDDELSLQGSGAKALARIDLFEADDAQSCEGKTHIGTTRAAENGEWNFVLKGAFNDAGKILTAIQQDEADGFSEFSPCFEIENKKPKFKNPGERGVTESQILNFFLKAPDPNGDPVSYACTRDCPEGLEVGPESGEVRWTPARGKHGLHNVAFQAGDKTLSDETVVAIRVEEFDTAPQLAEIEPKEVEEGEIVAVELSAADEDGDPHTFAVADGLREGMAFDAEKGSFSWMPGTGDVGETRILFRAVDDDKTHLFTEKEFKIGVTGKSLLPETAVESAAAPTVETPVASGEEPTDLTAPDTDAETSTSGETEAKAGGGAKASGTFSCNLNFSAKPNGSAILFWLIPLFLLLRCRVHSVQK